MIAVADVPAGHDAVRSVSWKLVNYPETTAGGVIAIRVPVHIAPKHSPRARIEISPDGTYWISLASGKMLGGNAFFEFPVSGIVPGLHKVRATVNVGFARQSTESEITVVAGTTTTIETILPADGLVTRGVFDGFPVSMLRHVSTVIEAIQPLPSAPLYGTAHRPLAMEEEFLSGSLQLHLAGADIAALWQAEVSQFALRGTYRMDLRQFRWRRDFRLVQSQGRPILLIRDPWPDQGTRLILTVPGFEPVEIDPVAGNTPRPIKLKPH